MRCGRSEGGVKERVPTGNVRSRITAVLAFCAFWVAGATVGCHPGRTPSPELGAVLETWRFGVGYAVRWLDGTDGVRIPLSIWYPAAADPTARALTFRDYFLYSDPGEGGDGLEELVTAATAQGVPLERVRRTLDEEGQARWNAQPLPGRFPVVALSPGEGGPAFHLPMLCEYLAANGLVVVAVPSRVWLGAEEEEGAEALTSARDDLLRALWLASALPDADAERLGLVGYSFGGTVAALLAMSDPEVDVLVTVDPGFRVAENYTVFEQAPAFDPQLLSQPFMVLYSGASPSTPDPRFLAAVAAEPLVVSFPDLRHGDFSSLLTEVFLFSSGDETRRDLERVAIGHDAAVRYVTAFLLAHLTADARSERFLSAEPKDNGLPEGLVSIGGRPMKRP